MLGGAARPQNPHATACWVFQGTLDRYGYGKASFNGQTVQAHQLFYWAAKGAYPWNMTIDHLCKNKACVNPDHMEIVTNKENMKRTRKTHCKYGHPLEVKWGRNRCMTCRKIERER